MEQTLRKFEINLDGETEDAIVSSSIAQAIAYLTNDLARLGKPQETDSDAMDLVLDIEAMKRVYNYYSLIPYDTATNA
jgi:hypothetical protein